jgi:hypothetical protein
MNVMSNIESCMNPIGVAQTPFKERSETIMGGHIGRHSLADTQFELDKLEKPGWYTARARS